MKTECAEDEVICRIACLRVNQEEAKAIAEAVSGMERLTVIEATCQEGGSLGTFLQNLNAPSLRELYAQVDQKGQEGPALDGLQGLADRVPSLQKLDLYIKGRGQHVEAPERALPSTLVSLRIFSDTLRDSAFELASQAPHLQDLVLGTSLGTRGCGIFPSSLLYLDLSHTSIDPNHLPVILYMYSGTLRRLRLGPEISEWILRDRPNLSGAFALELCIEGPVTSEDRAYLDETGLAITISPLEAAWPNARCPPLWPKNWRS